MSLSDGTRLGPYDIVAPLGAGGMGEVYRATDTRLKRQVAIKILPPALAADPDRLARFQREAEVLASLNHPHIAGRSTDFGKTGQAGVKALVMELVEGPTLADRIARGADPDRRGAADRATNRRSAGSGARAGHHPSRSEAGQHQSAGGRHREGAGLRAGEAHRGGRGGSAIDRTISSQSPTLTSPAAMTGMGMILGTAAYMSPEQARGRAVDKRTDVWAFGAVLYEMLTGARAFDGEDITEMIAAVVKSTPNWTALPADVPPHVVTLIQRCLEKDRNARIGDIAVARFLLAGHATLGVAPTPPRTSPSAAAPRSRQTMAWVLAGVSL